MTESAFPKRVNRTRVAWRGRTLTFFAGCDYFRMTTHPAVLRAVTEVLAGDGLSVAASRLTTGNHPIYRRLERALARFFGTEAALLLPAGYISNMAVTQALAGRITHALIDEKAHMSLADAALFLQCPVLRFNHGDPADLARQVRRLPRQTRVLVLTDGMFAHDGAAAPLTAYLRVLPRTALLLVDDAHGAGVLGKTGQGTPEWAGVSRRRVIQTVTLSKAFGVYGGAVLCTAAFRRLMVARSRLFGGCTPLPLPLASAALAALRLHRRHPDLRQRLRNNTERVKTALIRAGVSVPDTPGPIVTIVPGDARQARALRRRLIEAGIYPSLTRYPGGPATGSYRFVISSQHTPQELDGLIAALTAACAGVGPRGPTHPAGDRQGYARRKMRLSLR